MVTGRNNYDYAKELAKIDRELKIEQWMIITIVNRKQDGTKEILYRYDLPRYMYDKYIWVIQWREAKIRCQNPKMNIQRYLSFYDKTSKLDLGFNSLLNRIRSAKANITKVEVAIDKYKEFKKNDLFFNQETDLILKKGYDKLKTKISNYNELMVELDLAVIYHKGLYTEQGFSV